MQTYACVHTYALIHLSMVQVMQFKQFVTAEHSSFVCFIWSCLQLGCPLSILALALAPLTAAVLGC